VTIGPVPPEVVPPAIVRLVLTAIVRPSWC